MALFFYQFTPLYGHNPKNGSRDPRSRQKWSKKPEFCLPHPPKRGRAIIEVDKNREKCRNFVYRDLVSCHIGKCCQNQPARGPSSQRLIQMQHRITAASKSTGFYKKEPPKIGRFLRCAAFIFFSVIRS